MLDSRFENDGRPLLRLNKLQIKFKKIFEKRLKNRIYVLQSVKCIICGSDNFEKLAEKDRYGLYTSTVICKKCGLIQTNPRMTQKSYNEFYDKEYRNLYQGLEKPTKEFFEGQKRHGKKIYQFLEIVTKNDIKNKFVVEIGTGAGGILKYFKDKGNRVMGIDLGSEYVNFGKMRGLDLRVGAFKELPKFMKKEKPDIVICSHVIEHLLNPVEELKLLRKFLKKESMVYIEVPGIKSLSKNYEKDLLRCLQNAHTYYFTLNSLTNCTKKAGLEMIYGNEVINSLFKPGEIKETKDDYESAILFLRKLEKRRKSPLNLYRIKNICSPFLLFILNITGTRKITLKALNKIRSRM